MPKTRRIFLGCLLIAALAGCAATKQVRYVPARWVQDNDRIPISQPPTRGEYSIADGVQNQIFYQLERLVDVPLRVESGLHKVGFPTLEEAHNTNNFDEVADSTWFTNRLGKRPMTIDEARAGPEKGTGPNPQGPWKVTKAKHTGITPGFLIEDQQGVKYFLKFDPPDYPELSSGAEVISTRIMYAMGYNVAPTYIVNFSPDILRVSEKLAANGELTPEKLKEVFKNVPCGADGKCRAIASRFIEGKPIGPLPLRGRRRHDPNDRIPHEHRRELRGYRYFSAFIGNSDAREANTMDTFIQTGPGEKGYVKHFLLDFGSTLGSMGTGPKSKVYLNDYRLNYNQVAASTASLGAYRPKWEKAQDPGIPAVGMFEAEVFRPKSWNPNYPLPPFQYATDRDAFWATKIMTRLSDQQIAAIVKEAHYSDPRAEPYVVKTLIERRNKIRDYWFSIMTPLDNFELSPDSNGLKVSFEDLSVTSGMRPAGTSAYRFRILQQTGAYEVLPWTELSDTALSVPQEAVERLHPGKPYLLQVQSKAKDQEFFGPTIDLIIQKDGGIKLVGLNRRY